MANKYFVWKNGNPQEWEELTGKEFYALTKSDAVAGRYFTKMIGEDFTEDTLIMESTKEVFDNNSKDRKRIDYLTERDEGYTVVNFSTLDEHDNGDEDSLVMEEKIAADTVTDENDALALLALQQSVSSLSSFSELDKAILMEIIQRHSKRENYTTQGEIAKKFNLSLRTIIRREAKLRELFMNSSELLSHFE